MVAEETEKFIEIGIWKINIEMYENYGCDK